MIVPQPVHRALLSVDIQGSGRADRDNAASARAREVLFTELEQAFEASGVPWALCGREVTGDGMVVAVPPEFPKHLLVHPVLSHLAAGLRQHNRQASATTRVRVRAAVHAGDLLVDGYGATGRPQVLLARLLDAAPLRDALADAPETATVALLASDHFYTDVIAQGHRGVDPDTFTRVRVRRKETETDAWLTVIGHVGEFRKNAEQEREQPSSGGVTITGNSRVKVRGDLFGGDKRI